MEFSKVLDALEKMINDRMDKFTKIGKEIKELNRQNKAKHKELEKIFNELKPVNAIIREQNPKMCDLFDAIQENMLLESAEEHSIKKEKDGN